MGKITEEMPMNITVYLGANEGSDPALKQAVEELGRWIGESGNALVYGGSDRDGGHRGRQTDTLRGRVGRCSRPAPVP